MKRNTKYWISSSSDLGPVNSHTGWVAFVFGLILCSFIGGGIHTLLSPEQVHVWIQDWVAEENPRFHLQFSEAKLSLSSGVWPQLGIRVSGIKVSAKDKCVTGSELTISEAYLPISLGSLFEKRLRFKNIGIKELGINIYSPECNLGVTDPSEPKLSATYVKDDFVQQFSYFKKFLADRWHYEIQNSKSWFEGFYIDELKLEFFNYQNIKPVRLKNIRFALPDDMDSVIIKAEAYLPPELIYQQKVSKLNLHFEINQDHLKAKFEGHIDEGLIDINTFLDFNKDRLSLVSQWKHMPAKNIFSVLYKLKWLKEETSPKLTWLSCRLRYDSQVKEVLDSSIKVSECEMSGDLGHVYLNSAEIKPWDDDFFKSFKVSISKLKLNKISLNTPLWTEWSQRCGTLQGELEVFSKSHQKLVGTIEDIEFKSSFLTANRSFRLGAIGLNLDIKANWVSGYIDNKDEEQKKYWPPKISLNYKNNTSEFFVEEWNHPSFALKGLKVITQRVNGGVSGELKGAKLTLNETSNLQRWVQPLLLNFKKKKQTVVFKNLEVSFLKQKETLIWNLLQATTTNKVKLIATGEWGKSQKLKGLLLTHMPHYKPLRWDLSGRILEPMIAPSSEMLRELVKTQPEVKIPTLDSHEKRLSFLEEFLNKEKIVQLKKLGQSVFDTAKKVISSDGKAEEKKNETQVDHSKGDKEL